MVLCDSVVFFNDTATTEIYTLSLHDALPISRRIEAEPGPADRRRRPSETADGLLGAFAVPGFRGLWLSASADRKSTRLNSSHLGISYAVFCLKKKKNTKSTSTLHLYSSTRAE